MAADNLLRVISDLVKRDGRKAKSEQDNEKIKKAREKEAEKDKEDDEEEPEQEPEVEPEAEPEPKKDDKEDDDGYDNKPSGPDPTLVAQVAAIVKREIKDEEEAKKEKEVKLSGKKEKIDTTPTMKQEGKMNFREAIRAAVTGSPLVEGYESHVLNILEDEGIVGPLGYDPFFEKGKLFVQKGSEGKAKKALKQSGEINKLPKIVGEAVEYMHEAGYIKQKPNGTWCVYNEEDEIVKEFKSKDEAEKFLEIEMGDGNPVGESVDVDGRCKGFKEALRRLTYEKIRQMKEKAKKEEVEEGAEKDTKGDKEAYQKFFKAALKKFGVDEPDQLKGDKKKEFFDYIDKGWKADNEKPEPGDKKEEVEATRMPVEAPFILDKEAEVDEAVNLKKLKKEYEKNEDDNYHRENYLLLAKAFGTKSEIKKVEEIMKRSEANNSTSQKDNDWMYKHIMPYYDKIRNEEAEIAEISMEAGKVYHQDSSDGKMYFKAVEQQKNKRWKGLVMDIGQKKPKNGSADEKLRFWKETPEKDIPAPLKEQGLEEKSKKDYELYHKTYSDAVQHAADVVKKQGYEVDQDSWDSEISFGQRKPSKGKTVSKKVKLTKGGKEQKKQLHIQVYGMDSGKYELNMYVEDKQFSAFDKIRGIRERLNEGLDRHAVQELKLYIENDSDLYQRQIIPIVKNIQRKMKSGKYDHTKAPKLWMYLVDNGAKKYVKEFGGDVRKNFPKDVRHSVAVEFANEYRAEIEIQGGEMF